MRLLRRVAHVLDPLSGSLPLDTDVERATLRPIADVMPLKEDAPGDTPWGVAGAGMGAAAGAAACGGDSHGARGGGLGGGLGGGGLPSLMEDAEQSAASGRPIPTTEERVKRYTGHRQRRAALVLQTSTRRKIERGRFTCKRGAAVDIQKMARGRPPRENLKSSRAAAVSLQAHARGMGPRRQMRERRAGGAEEEEEEEGRGGGATGEVNGDFDGFGSVGGGRGFDYDMPAGGINDNACANDGQDDASRGGKGARSPGRSPLLSPLSKRRLKPNLGQPPRYLIPKARPASRLWQRRLDAPSSPAPLQPIGRGFPDSGIPFPTQLFHPSFDPSYDDTQQLATYDWPLSPLRSPLGSPRAQPPPPSPPSPHLSPVASLHALASLPSVHNTLYLEAFPEKPSSPRLRHLQTRSRISLSPRQITRQAEEGSPRARAMYYLKPPPLSLPHQPLRRSLPPPHPAFPSPRSTTLDSSLGSPCAHPQDTASGTWQTADEATSPRQLAARPSPPPHPPSTTSAVSRRGGTLPGTSRGGNSPGRANLASPRRPVSHLRAEALPQSASEQSTNEDRCPPSPPPPSVSDFYAPSEHEHELAPQATQATQATGAQEGAAITGVGAGAGASAGESAGAGVESPARKKTEEKLDSRPKTVPTLPGWTLKASVKKFKRVRRVGDHSCLDSIPAVSTSDELVGRGAAATAAATSWSFGAEPSTRLPGLMR